MEVLPGSNLWSCIVKQFFILFLLTVPFSIHKPLQSSYLVCFSLVLLSQSVFTDDLLRIKILKHVLSSHLQLISYFI